MSYKTILVQVDAFDLSNALVDLAVDLAGRFDAKLIGFAACNVRPILTAPDGLTIAGELFEQERNEIRERLQATEIDFRRMTQQIGEVEWRGYIGIPTRIVTEQARAADLVLTAKSTRSPDYDRTIDTGEFVLEAGRPVLVAAETGRAVGSRILVAWKNVREARRALVDALPFLKQAQAVRVVTVEDRDRLSAKAALDDVEAFLGRHGVTAIECEVIAANDGDAAPLFDRARSMEADMIVSGAYGHSRFREWILGGVTRSLLDDTTISRLMSN